MGDGRSITQTSHDIERLLQETSRDFTIQLGEGKRNTDIFSQNVDKLSKELAELSTLKQDVANIKQMLSQINKDHIIPLER